MSEHVVAGGADRRFMALALALGRRGLGQVWPNPAVGAVIVRHDSGGPVIVGRGWTQPGGRPHAETEALGRAGAAARGATLYVSLEPCSHHGRTPPCADAVIAAGIARVVSALEDPNPQVAGHGHARMRAAGIAVDVGTGAAEARQMHAGHIRRITAGRPQVTLKLAVSADGKAGAAGRRPVAITGEAARARAHLMRAQHDAIMVGVGTVLADDPELTCRLPGMARRSPVRVVMDAGLRTPLASRLVGGAGAAAVWVVAGREAPHEAARALQTHGAEVLRAEAPGGRVDLSGALQALAARGITRLLVEGGPTLAAAFVAADLVDDVALFRSAKIVGADGIDALEGMALTALTASPRLQSAGRETAGDDSVEFFARV